MKKLLVLACLLLVGCGNNNASSQDYNYVGGYVVFVDGTVVDKFLYELNHYGGIPRYDRYTYGHLIVNTDDHPIYGDKTFDVIVDEYVYNYYEIGDTIQFALKG